MIPAPFDYVAPATLEEALTALSQHGDDAKIIAGGQSLLPVLRMRLDAPRWSSTSARSRSCAAYATTATRSSSAP